MKHSPARVISQLLQDEGYVTKPSDGALWPLYLSSMPDGEGVKNDCLAVFSTPGVMDARILATGARLKREGFNIRVRALAYDTGWVKANDISAYLDTVHNKTVTVDATDYLIESISQPGTVLSLGQEPGTKRRSLFTVNGLVRIEEA